MSPAGLQFAELDADVSGSQAEIQRRVSIDF